MNQTQYFQGVFDPSSELGKPAPDEPLRPFVYPDGHQGWLITGHALARQVLADPRFSARAESKRTPVRRPSVESFYGRPTPPGWFLDMDAPEHTRFRRLLTRHFTARRMTRLRPRVERVTADCLDDLVQASRPADLVDLFTLPVPLQSICELLGVPYSQRRVLRRASETLFSLEASASAGAAAMTELTGIFLDLIRHRRAHPADDLISDLAGPGDLTDDELAGAGVLLLTAGHETVASMLGLGVLAVLSEPEHLPAFLGPQAAVAAATEELLRYLSIMHFGVPRSAIEDVELAGKLISAGAAVTVSLPAANRDPARYADPNALDLARDAAGHLAFGHGAHQCVGQNLARLEMRVAYPAVFGLDGLRLAEPAERIPLTRHGVVYSVGRLPVTWD